MNPLTPYLGAIKLIGWGLAVAALMGLGAWGGYKWQADNVAEAHQERDDAKLERDRYKGRAESFQIAIAQQKAASEAAVRAAQAQQVKADQAIAAAKAERDKYERKLAQIDAGIEKDKLDPACKAQLEAQVCGSPWE